MLFDLTQAFGVSGYESGIRNIIIENLKEYSADMIVDNIGNLIVFRKGHGKNKKRIMVCAHMDEIGLQVIKIEKNGLIKVRSLGSINVHTTYMNRVRFRNGTIGIVSSTSDIEKVRVSDIDNLYIDIGAKSDLEATEVIELGEVASYLGEYTELEYSNITSKALDNRVGCAILIETLRDNKEFYNDTYFVFTVQEEIGLRGVKVAANRINPDIGVGIDATVSFDTPNSHDGNVILGNGAAVKISDGLTICDEYLTKKIITCAKNNDIKYQVDVTEYGGTEISEINQILA